MTAEGNGLQRQLLTAQNQDGGWGYQPGVSWTEPTALAVIALAAHGVTGEAYVRAREWLRIGQKADGGWAPKSNIETSTWVTSLSLLALCDGGLETPRRRMAAEWILQQADSESGGVIGVLLQAFGIPKAKAAGGSPWYPGTAAWIAPSVTAVLALSEVATASSPDYQIFRAAIHRAQQYILSRKCRDGGWNHGGSSFRSENAESYPEMTGMALLALKGVPREHLQAPLDFAENLLGQAKSSEAVSWLQLALMSHGRNLPAMAATRNFTCRTSRDVSLRLLALAGPTSENKMLMNERAA